MASPMFFNPAAAKWTCAPPKDSAVEAFHHSLPDYNETRIVSLDATAKDLGLKHVILKDESNRFGLPAFKIVGASWAVYRVVAEKTGLDPDVSLEELGRAASAKDLKLVTCTEGNWGRAVARMGKYLGIPAKIYVPQNMVEATQRKIRSEGADVLVVDGNYDASIVAAREESEKSGALLVMDVSWEGYETIPQWVVEGYATMLLESDRQISSLLGCSATHAIVPVGVGSIAQAVTQHFKSTARNPAGTVITVEPDTAACLKTSLENGKIVTIETENSIMCGMNCGTVSTTAWKVLKEGVDASVIVTDAEAHEAVGYLHDKGVMAGPCGAATLAALKKLVAQGAVGLGPDSVVVLYCTEGAREYALPN